MKRKEIPQLTNQEWFPPILKLYINEFVTWFVGKVNAAKPFLPVVNEGLKYADKIIAMQMNVGAGFESLAPLLDKNIPVEEVMLKNFTADKKGLYISVNAFHQLKPDEALDVLDKISASGNPVVIVEGNNDSLWQAFGMTVILPLSILISAPFVKPFHFGRLIFTYLIPVILLVSVLDGFIALFKLYAPADLDEMIQKIQNRNYTWRSGKMDNGRGGKIIYLIGYANDGTK